jgi:hypothetical protein
MKNNSKNKMILKIMMGLFSIFLGWLILFLIVPPIEYKIDAQILFRDSIGLSQNMTGQHRNTLVSVLAQKEATDRQLLEISVDGLRQIRSIYIVIIAALISIVFSNNMNKKIIVIIIGVIVFMYYLDIHVQDLLVRQRGGVDISTKALLELTNISPSDTTNCILSYKDMMDQYEKLKKGTILRKLYIGLRPNIEMIVFYILPFVLSVIFFLREEIKSKNHNS